jgi:hypothetical protein
MDRTYVIVPTSNSSNSQYEVTFYYTAAERAGWEAATGRQWADIKIIKVKSRISNYTPATPAPDGANAIEIVTPTFGTYGTDYTLTATFSSGFSGFGAGVINAENAPLPVTLLDFKGRKDGRENLLEWSTTNEQNSKEFEVQKSGDGVSYRAIGRIKAAGTSTVLRNYSLRDAQVNELNYYRLNMIDIDGRSKVSPVVLIRQEAVKQNMWVVNNPFADFIEVRFAKKLFTVKLQLVTASGAVASEKVFYSISGQVHWQVPQNLARGSYILRAVVDGQLFTNKLVKQ